MSSASAAWIGMEEYHNLENHAKSPFQELTIPISQLSSHQLYEPVLTRR